MSLPEETNLASTLEDKEIQEIARTVIEEYKDDLESRSDWEEIHSKWLEIYYQKDAPSTGPWADSSAESIPILAEAVNQFQSRSYRAFFPNRYFIDAIPVGKPNQKARERAERVSKHMSFQLGVLDRTYKLNKNQMFLACALHGSDFSKVYWSPVRKRTMIERVRAQDLVVPYAVGPKRIDEIERKTHVKTMSINETAILQANGWFIEKGEPYTGFSKSSTMQDVSDDVDGVRQSPGKQNKEYCIILEQHRLLDLDGDGIAEPYIVWVDLQSEKVLRIQIRYEVDETGVPTNNKEPIEYFTHYQFLPNPDGFYGYGFGHLLGDINQGLNKMTRMFIDANELSVTGNLTYLISDQLGFPGDEFELAIGKGIKIPRSVDDIKKHFTQLKFEGPSQQTLQMMEMFQGIAQRLSANSDVLSGAPDKVYQPTAMLAMIEQGLQLFSSVQEFIGVSMEEELQKIYRLNAKYLPEQEYFMFGDEQIEVTVEDYQDDFRIVPIFDPKYATRSQKLAKAQAEYEFVVQNPLTQQDSEALYLTSRRYLEALDAENIDAILKPPQQQQPARIDDQNVENAYFMMPPDKRPLFDVFPDQDHMDHIDAIDAFIKYLDGAMPMDIPNVPGGDPQISRLLQSMGNDQKQELIANLLRHRALHASYLYGQMKGVLDENGNQVGQGDAGGMGASPNDTAGLQELVAAIQSAGGSPDMPA